ncbi:TetR/AcrR family transcriptional regulator [Leucobacter chromiireducens]|uniref:TetR/AcrR family transcriptional regulator n=1 Tax=Leucobacter chromiireducens TaxID=283877 RepID=UPI003F7DEED6
MARTPSFDRATVVRAARAVFWRDGYESAAVPRLEEATGLSRSSLYGAFGSKRGLFDEVVQNYLDEVVRPRLAPLQADEVAPTALREYLLGLREAFASIDAIAPVPGCLLINTAAGPVGADPEVARVIADYRAELHGALRRGVAAQPGRDPEQIAQLATVVTGLVVSAFALVRVDPDAAGASLDAALHAIEHRG